MSDPTFIQLLGGLINAIFLGGTGAALAPWFVKLARHYYEHIQDLKRETERLKQIERQETIAREKEVELLKKENFTKELAANKAMVNILQSAYDSANDQIKDLKIQLRHTDSQLSLLTSYMPYIEKFKAAAEKLEQGKKTSLEKERFPEQEHVVKGDVTIIRDKKE